MNDGERARIARAANEIARASRSGGAPHLTKASSREQVIRWLQWNDPNGAHTDELARNERLDPYVEDEAWEALAEMLLDT